MAGKNLVHLRPVRSQFGKILHRAAAYVEQKLFAVPEFDIPARGLLVPGNDVGHSGPDYFLYPINYFLSIAIYKLSKNNSYKI